MKIFFACTFFVLYALSGFSKSYYVAANGSDANTGTSVASPWKSIAKVNASFSLIAAGDSILFRSGDSFYGAIVVGKSGASGRPIVFSSYGAGAKPVITGFVTANSWVSVSTGIYQAYIPGAKSSLNMVTLNSQPQALGRYPNADAANGGYLNYESFAGATSITDAQLTTATNWVGAEVVVRKKLWVLDRCKITAHTSGTLTFTNTNSSTYDGTNDFGYFIQNDLRTLDKAGEWYFKNSTKNLQMYFGTGTPSSYSVRASCIDTLVTISSKNYININNLVFEGANGDALFATSSGYINIQNCDFINEGTGAIDMLAVSNVLIENCTTKNVLSNAIIVNSGKVSNVTIRGCSVKNTGTLPGMGLSNGSSYKGIITLALSNTLVEYNNIDTTGYVALDFQGSNVTIRNNVVNYFDFIKDDAGGIYTYSSGTDASPGTTYTNRVVSNNIVMNGIGAPYGRNNTKLYVSGIYLDGRTMNVNVLNNTVFNIGKNGIHCNNPANVTVRGNTSYNNLNAMSVMRWAEIGVIKNLTVAGNIFYPKNDAQRCLYYTNSGLNQPAATTLPLALANLASMDSNTYSMINPVGFNFEIYGTVGGALIQSSPYSFETWQSLTGKDNHGKKTAKVPVNYKITSLVGANKFASGIFNTSISGLTVYGGGTTATWDNTGKINGGALKIAFTAPVANKYNLLYSSIGAISSAKKYVLRFSTYGTTSQGIVMAYIRQTASPYGNLVASQTKSFGIGRKDHEFLFDAPATSPGGSFVIALEQNSGVTYIDNIEFYEVNATVYDPASQLRFEYNATKVARTIALDGNYADVNGTVYNNTLTLQPYTSIILVKDTAATTTVPPVATSLKAVATAPTINCYGSSTTVSVSASGGTAPYTGTGTFSATAGKGSLKLSFPTNRPNIYTYIYSTIGAISSAKNYVLRFSTLGTTANGKLRAAIRQTYTPWGTITPEQLGTFGTARKDHEFIFRAPATQTAASFMIEIEQGSGTTYIDNIAFFEADANGVLIGNNLYADGQIEANINNLVVYSSNSNHVAAWDNTGKITSTYYYAVKDAANSISMVPVTVIQPAAALSVTATVGVIGLLGGTTSAIVGATGGTAPYTGTGTFSSLIAGTYTYTVTDAKGCSVSKTVSVLPFVAARPTNTTAARTMADTNVIASIVAPVADATISNTIKVTAFPNPSTAAFNLQLVGGTNEKASITVVSFDGRIMYQATGNSNSKYSFGSNFMAGIYIVKVVQGAVVQTVKLVKAGN